jgi:hypothetical protein
MHGVSSSSLKGRAAGGPSVTLSLSAGASRKLGPPWARPVAASAAQYECSNLNVVGRSFLRVSDRLVASESLPKTVAIPKRFKRRPLRTGRP